LRVAQTTKKPKPSGLGFFVVRFLAWGRESRSGDDDEIDGEELLRRRVTVARPQVDQARLRVGVFAMGF
jgi:hypothetical protein